MTARDDKNGADMTNALLLWFDDVHREVFLSNNPHLRARWEALVSKRSAPSHVGQIGATGEADIAHNAIHNLGRSWVDRYNEMYRIAQNLDTALKSQIEITNNERAAKERLEACALSTTPQKTGEPDYKQLYLLLSAQHVRDVEKLERELAEAKEEAEEQRTVRKQAESALSAMGEKDLLKLQRAAYVIGMRLLQGCGGLDDEERAAMGFAISLGKDQRVMFNTADGGKQT